MPSIAATRIRTKIRSKWRKKNSLARSTGRGWATGDLGLWIFSRAGAGPKVGNAVPARNSALPLRGEWGVVPRGAHWSYGSRRRVPLPTPHSLGVQALLVAGAGELGELGVAHEARIHLRARAPIERRAAPAGHDAHPVARETESHRLGTGDAGRGRGGPGPRPPPRVAARIQTRTSTGPCRSRSRSTGCVLHTCHPIPHTASRFPTPIDHQPTVPSTHSAPSAIVVTTTASKMMSASVMTSSRAGARSTCSATATKTTPATANAAR